MAITEKRVDINNPGAYKMPTVRKSDQEIENPEVVTIEIGTLQG